MSKLTIDLDPNTHASLKRLAELEERSLTQYIGRVLRQHAGTLTLPTDQPSLSPKGQSTNKHTAAVINQSRTSNIKEEEEWSL